MNSMLDNLEKWNVFLDAVPDIIIIKDAQGRWLEANSFALRILRLEDVEYRGKRDAELFPEERGFHPGALCCQETDEIVWSSGKPARMEQPLSMPKGPPLILDVIKVPTYEPDGRRKGLVVIGRDVTCRKEAEAKLHLFGQVIDGSSEGIMITDHNRNIVYINPAFTSTTGYEKKDVLGKNPSMLQSGIHDDTFYHQMWTTIRKTGSWQGEIWNRRKNGEVYLEWLAVQAIRNEAGEITNYVGTFRDITEREKIRKDVALTGDILYKMLPKDTEDERIAIRTVYSPMRYVSGDLFDYTWCAGKTKLFGYLFDMMGHGLATAIQSSCLRVLFRQAADTHRSLAEKLKWINHEAVKYFTEETFAAAICFEIDFQEKRLTYASAGINHFLAFTKLVRGEVKVSGSFLGLMENQDFEQAVLPFESGDQFFFMSDGMFEIIPDSFKQRKMKLETAIKRLKEWVHDRPRRDDASAMGFQIK